MVKDELCEILMLKKEVNQLKVKFQDLHMGDKNSIVTDSVRGSEQQFPYLPKLFTITGVEENSDNYLVEKEELALKLKTKICSLLTKINNALTYIESIEDSTIRQILIYRYIDGLTWEQTGLGMSYSWETVRKKHDKFIKSIPSNTSIYDVK